MIDRCWLLGGVCWCLLCVGDCRVFVVWREWVVVCFVMSVVVLCWWLLVVMCW